VNRSLLRALLLALALPATAAAGPFLWSLEGPQATHRFVGSVHLLPEQAQPLPAALLAAADASAVFVFESDIEALADPAVQAQMLTAAQSAQGIAAEVGPDLHRRLRQRLAQIGLPEMLCDSFRAWFCSMTIEVMSFTRQGFRPDLGIDQQLAARAARQLKPREALESLDEHLGLFTAMSAPMSVAFLKSTLDEMDSQALSPDKLLDLWRRGDIEALAALVRQMKTDHPLAYERLLAARNRAWLPRIEARLRGSQPTLFVVGAAHYAGPDGLPALLKARGHVLRPVGG
jgi:uncharacterized protein